MTKVRRLDRNTVWTSLEINLTDDARIREIKKQVFGIDEITDVIALRYDPVPGIETGTTAEIFVNVRRAQERAAGGRWTAARELALYLAHGCDHLSGADDASEADYLRMRRRELRWLREADSLKLIDGILAD